MMAVNGRERQRGAVLSCRSWSFCIFCSSILIALVTAFPLHAQTVRGRLVEQFSGEPIPGAFVLLLDEAGAERARALTDAFGRFLLDAPGVGRYALRSAVVGLKSWTTEPFSLAQGEVLEYRIDMPTLPVQLPAVVVEADRNCRVRPAAGVAAGELWQEARKVLEAVVWTERQGVLQHRVVRYERELEPRTLEVRSQRTWSKQGYYRGSPFITRSPEGLAEHGYVRQSAGNEWVYDAPDARVLLSDRFADQHCFALRGPGRDEIGMIGLAFEPIRGRDVADVEGVLWLDAATAELRYLEYHYTRLPWAIESRDIGGRLVFERMPSGPWIVSRWWIRMPEVGLAPHERPALLGVKEDGGWVDEVRTLDGQVVRQVATSQLLGTVSDSTGERLLAGARVHLLGADRISRADRRGRFRFDSLTAGRYLLTFAHDQIRAERLVQPPILVLLRGGDTLSVALAVQTVDSLWVSLCPDSDPREEVGILAGLVRDASTGELLLGTRVVVAWNRYIVGVELKEETLQLEGVADERGYYHLCGVPLGVPLTVEATREGWEGAPAVLRIQEGRVLRYDFELKRQ